jgi:cytochrome c oxidase cbb3-type subunit I/II
MPDATYIREGCVGCHSQMIRPPWSETEHYGEYSKAGEFVYDHPPLGFEAHWFRPPPHRWKYSDGWHFITWKTRVQCRRVPSCPPTRGS